MFKSNIKIGILTFHNANNYGAVLQAFALQESLKNIYYEDISIIDYRSDAIERRYHKRNIVNGTLKHIVRVNIERFFEKLKYKKFNRFRNEFLNIKLIDNLTNNYYDYIVVGSDQVWNYKLTECDWTYFLENINYSLKKISYAPSFGLDHIDDIYKEKITTCLNSFYSLSVREKTGKQIINSLLNKDVPVVVDPTLLLSKEEWISKLNININIKKRKYILVYLFGKIDEGIGYAKWLSEKKNLSIICIDTSLKKVLKGKYVRCASPKEWVELFANAKYVITNSFHGLMFSVIFQKEFYIAPLQQQMKTNSRIDDFLNYIDLNDRKISDFKINNFINYDQVYNKLNKMIEDSKIYLSKIKEEV